MPVSYAQNLEDVMLWRALGHVEHGRYIDIGAQDPIVDSVSLMFYEHGWRGIHVEPAPPYAELLRKARPDEVVIEAAVVAMGGIVPFYEFPNTGLSTGDREIAEGHISSGFAAREIVVPGITLDEVFSLEPGDAIHWLKIDVEGGEEQLLSGWVHSTLRPWVVLIESTLPLTQTESYKSWEPLLLRKGYKFAYFDGLNRFYIANGHRDLLKAFASGPNVFDGFTLSGTASSVACDGLNDRIRFLEDERVREQQDAARLLRLQQEQHSETLATLDEEARQARQTNAGEQQALREQLLTGHANFTRLVDTLNDREREFRTREQELSAQLIALQAAAASQTEALAEKLHSSQTEAIQLGHALSQKNQDLARIQAAMSDLLLAQRALADELARMRRTWSWKFTAPFRIVARWFFPSRSHDSPRPIEPLGTLRSNPLDPNTIGSPPNAASNQLRRAHAASANGSLPVNAASNVTELLQHDGQAFVECCYRTLLLRDSDESGRDYYVGRLLGGASKLQILSELSTSPECLSKAIHLPGLSDAIKKYKLANLPLLGGLFGLFFAVERNSKSEIRLRGIEQQILLFNKTSHDRVDQSDRGLNHVETGNVQLNDRMASERDSHEEKQRADFHEHRTVFSEIDDIESATRSAVKHWRLGKRTND